MNLQKPNNFWNRVCCGGEGGGSGGSGGSDPIGSKMDRDNSVTSGSDVSGWGPGDVRGHAAAAAFGATNGWASSSSLNGCTGCHEGRFDAIGGSNHTFGGGAGSSFGGGGQ